VDYRLVSAMIRQESNWQQASVSSKGAVGLMQLMPATAAMLNVNPHDPVENIRGGIAYLAGLLHTYGDLRYALIAYNAGPTHANQVIRGERGLFAETRRYLDAIAAMYPLN
jgi:soluble lytic murein transglycosylase-like protein